MEPEEDALNMFDIPILSILPFTRSYISNLTSLPTPEKVQRKRNAILSPTKQYIMLKKICKRLEKIIKN